MHAVYTLPGDAVFPEGITTAPGGTFHVGSSRDGTVYRGSLDHPETEVWLPAGSDGRTCVLGLTVHAGTRLVACGGDTGHLYVYDLRTAALVARRTAPDALLNDVWIVGDTAYVTDSRTPVVWRLPLGDSDATTGELEVFATVEGAGTLPFLNGITATPDGSALLVAAQGDDSLWRVDLATAEATRVEVGAPFGPDGMLLLGDALYGLVNEGTSHADVVFYLSEVCIAADGRSGVEVRRWREDCFDAPTTLAYAHDRLLLVNSQMHKPGAGAPFQVVTVALPE
ncbi:hypothetical protein Cs7R123_34240 [Catellatospora sp. TT07R-123]|uniref:SMP-30/gluconolactonase/LRE family protein n=1 Tax=Catellatospora sp. TT07R-123 TaxID=2733863 RepID=UPI001B0CA719|nr:hypothetical protein [Catellatospora sp. TT07R-123]GHJ46082.1 hypothetical protein Cs7R123_34240 [Catellatospora sp. TT07R-123]